MELTRQYYLRVVSARDGSPAAKAGLRTGDYIRAIDGRATRDMSAYEGMRLLRGAAGSKIALLVIRNNATDPHELSLVRERTTAAEVTTRMADASTGYVRVAEFSKDAPAKLTQAVGALTKTGATRFVVDLRGTATGDIDNGIAAARLFVPSGTLAIRQTKAQRETITAGANDGSIGAPVILLVDQGTAAAAELFAARFERQRTRGTGRRAHARSRRAPATREASRRQRAAALVDALSDPRQRRYPRTRSDAGRPGPSARCGIRRRTSCEGRNAGHRPDTSGGEKGRVTTSAERSWCA